MNVSVVAWLNQWLPFAKWLTVAALLFLFPLLLEACNRLRSRTLALSASQRHDVWGIALIVWALSPIPGIIEVTCSIPINATVPATVTSTDTLRSLSDFDLPPDRIPSTSNETISSKFELQVEKEKALSMEHPVTLGSKPLLERVEPKDRLSSSTLSTFLGWRHVWIALYSGGTVLFLIRLVRSQVFATALVRSAELVHESKWIEDLRGNALSQTRFAWAGVNAQEYQYSLVGFDQSYCCHAKLRVGPPANWNRYCCMSTPTYSVPISSD